MTSRFIIDRLPYINEVMDRKIKRYKPTLTEAQVKAKCHLENNNIEDKIKSCCKKGIPLECLAAYHMKLENGSYEHNKLADYMKSLLISKSYTRDIKLYILRLLYVLRFKPDDSDTQQICKLLMNYTNDDCEYKLKNLWKKTEFDKHAFNAIYLSLVRMPTQQFKKLVSSLQNIEKQDPPTTIKLQGGNDEATMIYVCIPKFPAKSRHDFMWWVDQARNLDFIPHLQWDSKLVTWKISEQNSKVPEILLMYRQQSLVQIQEKDVKYLTESFGKDEWKNTNL